MIIFRSAYAKISSLLSLLLMVSLVTVIAQDPAETAGPIVKSIGVETVGAPTISKERVLANLATKVGQPYSERTAEQDVRSLYTTGGVSNVRIFAEPLGDGVKVTVLLQGRPVLEEVLIEGTSQIPLARVRRNVAVNLATWWTKKKSKPAARKSSLFTRIATTPK